MLIVTLFISMEIPAHAWVHPNGREDSRFESYGPHVKGILLKLYNNEEEEWTAMDNNQIDFEDWPLTATWINTWQNDPRFQLKNIGGETGYFILDINKNNNPTLSDESTNPAYIAGLGNPCSVLEFRQALAYIVNRTFIISDILSGLALPIWTPVPAYMTTYVDPNIKPGGILDNLTYGGMEGNVTAAVAKLNNAHFLYVPAEYPWRFWDKNGDGHYQAGEEFAIIFWVDMGYQDRFAFDVDYNQKLESDPIRINVDFRASTVRPTVSDWVMGRKSFHIYAGGWISIGPDPDFLYDLYHSSMYWHPGKPTNYGDGYDALLDHYAEEVKFALNATYGMEMTMKFQGRFAELAWSIPLWCNSGIKAFRRVPVEEPGSAEWTGVVNQAGFGVNSYWTFLDLMKECEYYPPIYATYGQMTPTIEWMNPIYAQWYWDWEVLNKIYESCAVRDPYSIGDWVPQLAKNWEVGTWIDPADHNEKVKVRITLRPDLYWQDGAPVTVADLAYSYVECSANLRAKGIEPPVWWPTVQFFKSYYVLDPFNIEFLVDVPTVWAVGWVLEIPVIPKHIWKPIVDASTQTNNLAYQRQPDPNCIGSGPFRFAEYIPNNHLLLVANTPNSIVHSITSPGYWQYYPIHVNVQTDNYRVKLDPGYPGTIGLFNFTVTLHNLWLNQSDDGTLIVSRYVYIDNNLNSEVHDIHLRSSHSEEVPVQLLLTKCKHEIRVAVHVDGPSMLDAVHSNPWVCQWINVTLPVWVTIKQDVGGATYQGMVVAPDCKVDGKDIAFASSAFNTVPGQERWNSVADVSGDYKVDGKDLAHIARSFGKW